jgi:hypothetical protein
MRSAREIPAQAELERGTLLSKMSAMARASPPRLGFQQRP